MTSLLNEQQLQRLCKANRVYLGFSGGLDSTVLLHALSEHPAIHQKITAIHINHGLSQNAHAWQTHCQAFCDAKNTAFQAYTVDFIKHKNIEAGARDARFKVFASLLNDGDYLVLAHHLNDQAETVLMQLFRGAGVDGLCAMSEASAFAKGTLFRPLLSTSRADLESYAADYGLSFVTDESNQDVGFSRNYLRHEIMPLIISKWPKAEECLARAALHCQEAQTNLEALAKIDNSSVVASRMRSNPEILELKDLKSLPYARLSNVLRHWLHQQGIVMPSSDMMQKIIQEVIFAKADANPVVHFGSTMVRRYQERLYIVSSTPTTDEASQEILCWQEFPKPLLLPNAGGLLSVVAGSSGINVPNGAVVTVRFRKGAEVLVLHGQTKKLKTLFQEWKIPPWQRSTIPLVYFDNQLAVVVGYEYSDLFATKNNGLLIQRR